MQFAKDKKQVTCKTSFRESLAKMRDNKGSLFDKELTETGKLGHFSDESKHVDWNGGKFDALFDVVKLSSEIKRVKPMAVKRVKRRVVSGIDGELNIDNMWTRKPYDRVTKRIKTSNVITVSIEYSFTSNKSSNSIDAFTLEVLKAVQSLMLAGYSVGVEVTNCTINVDKNKTINSSSVVIKRPDDKLSIQDIARVFTSNYYRRVVLNLREQSLKYHGIKSRYTGMVTEKPYRVKLENNVVYIGNNLNVKASDILGVLQCK